MSFGYAIGDGLALAQLAYRVVQGARKACGEHDDLTREVSSLQKVLDRLQRELANPQSLLNRADDDRRSELDEHGRGCEAVLNVMDAIITKYNNLVDKDGRKTATKLWQKVKFGNGEMRDLAEIRLKLSTYTTAINMSLNLCSLGSQGRVEKELNNVGARFEGSLEGIRVKVDWIAATMTAKNRDGTVWTSYENDDREFWRQLRRELVSEGYKSSVLHKHKALLKSYVQELGQRGVFDEAASDSGVDSHEARQSQEGPPNTASVFYQTPGSTEKDSTLPQIVAIPHPTRHAGPNQVTLEEIIDEDFLPNAHPMCSVPQDPHALSPSSPKSPTRGMDANEGFSDHVSHKMDIEKSPPTQQPEPKAENKVDGFVWVRSDFTIPYFSASPRTDQLGREWKRRQTALRRIFEVLKETHLIFEDPSERRWLLPVADIKTWEGLRGRFAHTFPNTRTLNLFESTTKTDHRLGIGYFGRERQIIRPATWQQIVRPWIRIILRSREDKHPAPVDSLKLFAPVPGTMMWPDLSIYIHQYLQLILPESLSGPMTVPQIQRAFFSKASYDMPQIQRTFFEGASYDMPHIRNDAEIPCQLSDEDYYARYCD